MAENTTETTTQAGEENPNLLNRFTNWIGQNMPSMPEMPELNMPEMPELTMPEMPKVSLPEVDLPSGEDILDGISDLANTGREVLTYGGEAVSDAFSGLTGQSTEVEVDPRVAGIAETMEEIRNSQDQENVNFQEVWDNALLVLGQGPSKLLNMSGAMANAALSEQNRAVWTTPNEEVIQFYAKEFPKLPMEDKRAIANTIQALEGAGDHFLGDSVEGASGAYAIAMAVHHNTADLGGIVADFGGNLLDRARQGLGDAWNVVSTAWSQEEGHIGQKLMASLKSTGSAIGAFASSMNYSIADNAGDIILDRTFKIQQDIASLGFDERVIDAMGPTAVSFASAIISDKSGERLNLDADALIARVEEQASAIAYNAPPASVATEQTPPEPQALAPTEDRLIQPVVGEITGDLTESLETAGYEVSDGEQTPQQAPANTPAVEPGPLQNIPAVTV